MIEVFGTEQVPDLPLVIFPAGVEQMAQEDLIELGRQTLADVLGSVTAHPSPDVIADA